MGKNNKRCAETLRGEPLRSGEWCLPPLFWPSLLVSLAKDQHSEEGDVSSGWHLGVALGQHWAGPWRLRRTARRVAGGAAQEGNARRNQHHRQRETARHIWKTKTSSVAKELRFGWKGWKSKLGPDQKGALTSRLRSLNFSLKAMGSLWSSLSKEGSLPKAVWSVWWLWEQPAYDCFPWWCYCTFLSLQDLSYLSSLNVFMLITYWRTIYWCVKTTQEDSVYLW